MTTAVAVLPEPLSVSGISQSQFDRQSAFREDLERNMPQILAVLPAGVRGEALAAASMTAALDNPKLLDCSPVSMMRAVLKMATLGLRIGETCDLIPVDSQKHGKRVECWVRVKGVVELAVRAGAIRWAREGYVCTGDQFEHDERDTGTHFVHRANTAPASDGSNLTHVYAIIVLKDGTRVFEVWPIARVLEHKRRFAKDTKPGSVWDKHPLPMMAKSVVKSALRFAPLSPEMRQALSAGDESIPDGSMETVDDPTQALALASGALDALAGMDFDDDADDEPEVLPPLTLESARAMILPGKPEAFGGRGGQPLANLSHKKLAAVFKWASPKEEFARLAAACDILLAQPEPAAEGAS